MIGKIPCIISLQYWASKFRRLCMSSICMGTSRFCTKKSNFLPILKLKNQFSIQKWSFSPIISLRLWSLYKAILAYKKLDFIPGFFKHNVWWGNYLQIYHFNFWRYKNRTKILMFPDIFMRKIVSFYNFPAQKFVYYLHFRPFTSSSFDQRPFLPLFAHKNLFF